MAKSVHPHDEFFKLQMSKPEVATDFFKQRLPAHIVESLDFSTLKLEKESFADGAADILYSTRFGDKKAYLYMLCEHKSYPDRALPLQMARYVIQIMSNHVKKYKLPVPIVIPLCIYHGKETPYPYTLDFFELFDDPDMAKKLLCQKIPMVDLNQLSNRTLSHYGKAGVLLGLQKIIHARDFLRHFEPLLEVTLIKALLRESNKKDLQIVLEYICNCADITDEQAFIDCLSDNLSIQEDEIMPLADKFFNRGIQKGIQKGMQKGMQKGIELAAQNMLRESLPVPTIQRLTGLSQQQIQRLAEQQRLEGCA